MAILIDDKTAETTEIAEIPETGGEWASRLDGYVQRAGVAAVALRALDQEAVDRIVRAMSIAGLENAIDLAELAMEETQFGVLEDKVIKNYIATEFLYDYLKDKKSVGIIDEDRERAIQYVAEPIGVVLALLPITKSDLDRAVQVDRLGQDAQRADHETVGSRRSLCGPRRGATARGGRSRRATAERAAGDPGSVVGRLPVSLPSSRRRLHLDDRRPEGGCRRQRGRQALPQCRLGQRARVPTPEL